MTVLNPDHETEPSGNQPLSVWVRLVAFIVGAIVLIVVIVVTRSAEAVAVVTGPLLLLLGWLTTGRSRRPD